MKTCRYLSLVIAILISHAHPLDLHAAQENEYTFSVFPYLSAVRLSEVYAPVTKDISIALDTDIKFLTSTTFKKYLIKLKSGSYDFALIQPFWYPVAVDKAGYIPLVKMKEPFVSLIMVEANSSLQSASDLRNKTIATPPAFVPVVHMAYRELDKRGLKPGKDVFFKAYKSVDSCFQQMLAGNAVACVAPPFAPGPFERAMKVNLRSIVKSSGIPNLALVANKRVPEQDRERVRKLFLSFSHSEHGRELLKRMHTEGFTVIDDKEYDAVRSFIKEVNQ